MERVELAEAAALAGAVAAPLVLLARRRLALFAGIALLAAAEAGLAFALVPAQLEAATASAARIAAVLAGLTGLGLLAALFARFPASVPAALLLAAPVRIPLDVRGEEAFLLVPLYAVLASCALATGYRLARGDELRPLPLFLALPTGAFVALAAISLVWSSDAREGTIRLFFFLFPSTVLVAVLAQARVSDAVYRSLAVVLLASTTAAAAIGISQQWTHDLYFADDLQSANAYTTFFRVTSFFGDPSVYGRYIALGIVVLFVLLWFERIRLALALPLLAVLCAGLYFSYSQSSFAAVAVAVLVVTVLAGDQQTRVAVAVAAVAVALAGVGVFAVTVQDESLRRASSGRSGLASTSGTIFLDHPVVGVGIGAQPAESRRLEEERPRRRASESHTTPLTVAAELGVLGLAAYAAFLLAAVRGAQLALRREPALGLSLVGVLTVLFVHSLVYGGFFEDPFVWFALGLTAACLASTPAPAGERARGRLSTTPAPAP
jgi:O-antigen ligase